MRHTLGCHPATAISGQLIERLASRRKRAQAIGSESWPPAIETRRTSAHILFIAGKLTKACLVAAKLDRESRQDDDRRAAAGASA